MINHGISRNSTEGSNTMARLRLSYGHKFTKPQRTLRVNFDGTLQNGNQTSYNYTIRHFTILPTDTLNQRVQSLNNTNRWNMGITYTEPLIRDFILSLSYNVSSSENSNERLQHHYNPITNKFDDFDTVFSNNFGDYFFQQNVLVQIQKQVEKYNYSLGLGMLPSHRSSFVEGQPDVPQSVFNLAPQARFSYKFDKQTSLNLRYNGSTRQPRTFQLQHIPTNTDPSNVFLGNPELKPEFNHQIHAQFSHFSEEKKSNIFASFWFDLTQNHIANVTIFNPDLFPDIPLDSAIFRPGGRITTYDNVDLIYSGNGHMTYGMPFFNEKLRISVSASGSIRNSKAIIDNEINIINTVGMHPNLSVMWKRDAYSIRLSGGMGKTNSRFSLQSDRNNVSDFSSLGADFTWQIIKDKLSLSTDINYQDQRGLAAGLNPTFTLWNAQLSYNIGKKNDAQLLLRVVDILNDRQDTWRWASGNSIQDITYFNTLRRFFMVSFIYNKRQTATQ